MTNRYKVITIQTASVRLANLAKAAAEVTLQTTPGAQQCSVANDAVVT